MGCSVAQYQAVGRSPGAVWEMRVGAGRCVLHMLPAVVTAPVCSSRRLTNGFVRLISKCSLFIMAITQLESQDSVPSLNNGFSLCQTCLRVEKKDFAVSALMFVEQRSRPRSVWIFWPSRGGSLVAGNPRAGQQGGGRGAGGGASPQSPLGQCW